MMEAKVHVGEVNKTILTDETGVGLVMFYFLLIYF